MLIELNFKLSIAKGRSIQTLLLKVLKRCCLHLEWTFIIKLSYILSLNKRFEFIMIRVTKATNLGAPIATEPNVVSFSQS